MMLGRTGVAGVAVMVVATLGASVVRASARREDSQAGKTTSRLISGAPANDWLLAAVRSRSCPAIIRTTPANMPPRVTAVSWMLLDPHRATVMQATPATWRMPLEVGWLGGAGSRRCATDCVDHDDTCVGQE